VQAVAAATACPSADWGGKPPRWFVSFGACSCPLPQGLDRLRRCAAPLGGQAGFPALPSLRSVQGGCPQVVVVVLAAKAERGQSGW